MNDALLAAPAGTFGFIKIRPADPAELALHWQRVEPLLAQALELTHGRYLPIDVLMMCGQGRLQAWFCQDGDEIIAMMMTSEQQYPRRKVCQCFLVSGERMDDWLDLWTETVEAYARSRGCDHLEGQGRPGWARVTGTKVLCTVIVKDL